MKSFPFKFLIGAITLLLGLLIFKESISHLIFQTEEVTILDQVTIKVNKDESKALEIAQAAYESKISDLSEDINTQKSQINSLQRETEKLLEVITNCQQAKAEAKILQEKVDKIQKMGGKLQEKSAVLNKTHVYKKKNRGK